MGWDPAPFAANLSLYSCEHHINHIKYLVMIGSVSPRWRSRGTRFLLHVYLLFSRVSFINTFKHVKGTLYLILWILYCLVFLSIEQILFVIYLLGWRVSFINTFKHVKDTLYVILWILYCLAFLSLEQILFVIYLLGWRRRPKQRRNFSQRGCFET